SSTVNTFRGAYGRGLASASGYGRDSCVPGFSREIRRLGGSPIAQQLLDTRARNVRISVRRDPNGRIRAHLLQKVRVFDLLVETAGAFFKRIVRREDLANLLNDLPIRRRNQ